MARLSGQVRLTDGAATVMSSRCSVDRRLPGLIRSNIYLPTQVFARSARFARLALTLPRPFVHHRFHERRVSALPAQGGGRFRVPGCGSRVGQSPLGARRPSPWRSSTVVGPGSGEAKPVRPSQARSASVHPTPTPSNSFKPWTTALLVATLFALAPRAAGADAKRAPGLVVTFTSGERRDSTLASEVALYVEAGKPPTPFLPGGKFTATWEGAI